MAKTTSAPKVAFKCKNCGNLEPSEAAGENRVPRACRICRAGVRFTTEGGQLNIFEQPSNWIVLADLSQKELKESGLTADQVATHKSTLPAPPKGTAKTADAFERMGAKDRG